jgi:RNA polymerase sigma-70 factor (ECF subfamily)
MTSTSQPPEPTDADAIAASVDHPAAFDTVFERHVAVVHAFAQRRIGLDLAEDITAETFARAFAARSRFDRAQPSARPWLLGIASNVMRRHWRTERRRLAAYAKALNDDRPGGPPTEETAALAALARLPLRQREVVLLHAWGDLSYEEIARALDVPIGTVRSRLARARRSLTHVEGALRSRPPLNDAPESSHA